MSTAQDFEDFAQDCARMATQAYCPKLRDRLFELAREWMRAARNEVRRVGLRPKTQNDQGGCREEESGLPTVESSAPMRAASAPSSVAGRDEPAEDYADAAAYGPK
jgi:hypothetical protein